MKLDIMKVLRSLPVRRLWDALVFILIILALAILLSSPIWLSFLMPTGS